MRFGVTRSAFAPVLASIVNDATRPSFILRRCTVAEPTVCHHVNQNPTEPLAVVVCTAFAPTVVVVGVTAGVVPPVKPALFAVINGCGRFCTPGPSYVTVIAVPGHGPPGTVTDPVPRFGSASSAVST